MSVTSYRRATRAELDTAIEWAADEGWNPGDGDGDADSLFVALVSHANGAEVTLDVPEVNVDGLAVADRYGLTESFGCARMYLGAAPPLPWSGIYGVTTFELG